MKQVAQNIKTGEVAVQDVPAPLLRPRGILVRSRVSLVSAGTERMVMELAKKGLLGKARARPDLVKKVLAKLRRDGFLATLRTVRERLDSVVPLGYSLCGDVLAVGGEAPGFELGQRVACAGAGYANHAERNYIPRLLAAAVPSAVSDEAAAYTTVGAIALQGIRNADLRVGESVVVLGLGLIGQLSVQLLKAAGCRVAGLDPAADRVRFALEHGADVALELGDDRVESVIRDFTRGRGADAVLIAAATASNAPVEMAARLARDRARVIMVGVTGMELPRKAYFEKELTFLVSRSYGPGRYDRQYEEQGQDYPAGYVRWTENRNMEAFLDLVASGAVRPEVCTTHRFPIDDAVRAFELVLSGREPYLGVVLTYPSAAAEPPTAEPAQIVLRAESGPKPVGRVGVSLIGAGGFARSVHLPNLARMAEVDLRGILDASGMAGRAAATKFGAAFCAADEEAILGDAATDAVLVATPHSQHAAGVVRALAAGKAVFVEKPLAISLPQLGQVAAALAARPGRLMVGFNRRFAPLAVELKSRLAGRAPLAVQYRCNAGPLPGEHWIADPAEGGRILGEACHFFDFFAFLTGAAPQTVWAAPLGTASADDAAITVSYADGSACQLLYSSGGPAAFSKERVEVFGGGAAAVLEDFRSVVVQIDQRRWKRRHWLEADKGHRAELAAFLDAVRSGGPMPIAPECLVQTTLVGLAALESIRRKAPVAISALEEEMVQLGRAETSPLPPGKS